MDLYGRMINRTVRDALAGPTFVIAGGAQVSQPVWIQGADEQPVTEPGQTLDPNDIPNGWILYDDAARLAAELISVQYTPDRVNWFTFSTPILGATIGVSATFALQATQPTRGVRLRSAVAVGAAGRSFPSNTCRG